MPQVDPLYRLTNNDRLDESFNTEDNIEVIIDGVNAYQGVKKINTNRISNYEGQSVPVIGGEPTIDGGEVS
jgi:hypothetical protein